MRITDANYFELNSYSYTLVNYPSVMEKQNPKTTGVIQEDTRSASQFPAEAGKTSSFSLSIPSSHMLSGTDQEEVERTAVWSGRKNGWRMHLGRGCHAKSAYWLRKMFPVPSGNAQRLTQRSWANSNERELSRELWRWHVWDGRQHHIDWRKSSDYFLPKPQVEHFLHF